MSRTITRFDPFRETVTLRDAMNRLMEDSFVRTAWPTIGHEGEWSGAMRLPLDVYTTKEAIVIVANVPGLKPEDVEITIEGDTLAIRGERPGALENVQYLMHERTAGRFARTLQLNIPIQAENTTAEFENGVLTITLPKAETVRPRTIKVNTNGK